MVAWIIYFREAAEYNREYIKLYIETGARLGVDVRLIIAEDLKFGVKNNSYFILYRNEEIAYPDFAICRAIYPLMTRQLELMGIKVYNNSFVAEICNDKARTYQYLARTGIAMADTEFYKSFQLDDVLSDLNEARVIKAVGGHGGNQVFLVDPAVTEDKEIAETKKALSGSDLVVQPKIGNRNQDLRVYVIGKEIIAAVLRTARQGFKSNYSLGGEVALYELSKEEKELVKLIIDQFDFGLVGIDFIVADDGRLIFNEIEDVVGARMLYKCSDINIVEKYLRYIIDNLKA
ncbi:MAG: ATP-grasp domain-containing protein [Clostridiales bacterium]|nr:ATP-grasp domain-containing protein [Clostridiales bacterium]